MSGLIPSEFGGDFDPSDFEVAGFLPFGADFDGGYVNTEGWEYVGEDNLTDADYVVIHDTELDIYFTLAGPFDDYEDLEVAIQEWYEEGS